MQTKIRLMSTIFAGALFVGAVLSGCATDTYVSQENREKFADVNVSKFLISECLAPQREIHIGVAEHFDFDKYNIREEDIANLDAFIRDIRGLSGRITIAGHTDYKGSSEYNDKLSLRRAQSVETYLKQHLEPAHYDWEVKHLGETQPLLPGTSDHDRAENRRAYILFEQAQKYEEMPFCEPPKPERKVFMAMTPHFDFDKSELKPEDLPKLDEFIASLEGLEGSILIAGHTDQIGSRNYNQKLAERRAYTVMQYLKTKLTSSQLDWEVKAFGELQPVLNEVNPEANALNRRAFIVFRER